MPDEVSLVINPDGTIDTIYSDKIKALLESAGGEVAQVCRASNVEWEAEYKGWTVRAARDPEIALRFVDGSGVVASKEGEILAYPTREAALEQEVKHFWALIGKDVKP